MCENYTNGLSISWQHPFLRHTIHKISSWETAGIISLIRLKRQTELPPPSSRGKVMLRWGCFPYLMACSLWALRTSGFWFLFAMISVIVAPVIALWNFVVLRVLFLFISSDWPFLCLRLNSTVQLISRGFRFIKWDFSHFWLMKKNVCNVVCDNVIFRTMKL